MGTGRHNNKHTSQLPQGVRDITKSVKDKGNFHIFNSRARDSHNYVDDGGKTAQFFKDNSNAYELMKKMNMQEIMAFYDWSSGNFMGLNKTDFAGLSKPEQEQLRIYDKYLDQAELTKGIVVRRLASFSLINNGSRDVPTNLDALKDTPFEIISPLSTAAAREGLTIGCSSKNVEYVFHIPPSKGAGMWIGDSHICDWDDTQREYVVNRNTVFTMGGYKYNSTRGVYEIDMYYVGRQKHKY